MAVREGFEPSIRVNVYTLSRRAPSATRTPHRFAFAIRLGSERGVIYKNAVHLATTNFNFSENN